MLAANYKLPQSEAPVKVLRQRSLNHLYLFFKRQFDK